MTRRDLREVLRKPIVVAPMGGGPSTPALVIAAAQAGGFGMLAGGYKSVAAMTAEISAVRAATSEPFGINLFMPGTRSADSGAIKAYVESLAGDAEAVSATIGEPVWDDDGFYDKAAALLDDPPALVTFTFGCPSAELVASFHRAGSLAAVTVTDPEESVIAAGAGVDALCVQGMEAGAHRGTFANDDRPGQDHGLLALIGEVAGVTDLPQIAAGGIMSPAQVRAVLAAGAAAAQCGTAFLRCPESGAHPLHKEALASGRYTATAFTRAFSGRRARGLVNRFMLGHADAPAAYPEINNVTRPLRAAAAAAGDSGRMSLWAGQGFRAASDRAAGEVVEKLASALDGHEWR